MLAAVGQMAEALGLSDLDAPRCGSPAGRPMMSWNSLPGCGWNSFRIVGPYYYCLSETGLWQTLPGEETRSGLTGLPTKKTPQRCRSLE